MEPDGLVEVTKLREVPATPEHCGRRMRKLTNPSGASGTVITVWYCDGCGGQERETA